MRGFEKRGPLLTFVCERGPCAPAREGERLAKNEKELKTNQKKKTEKGQRC